MSESKAPPTEITFRAGAIWAYVNVEERTVESKRPKLSIRVLRRWWDTREKRYRTTTYLQPWDLPNLMLVASKAYEHIMLHAMPNNTRPGDNVSSAPRHTESVNGR